MNLLSDSSLPLIKIKGTFSWDYSAAFLHLAESQVFIIKTILSFSFLNLGKISGLDKLATFIQSLKILKILSFHIFLPFQQRYFLPSSAQYILLVYKDWCFVANTFLVGFRSFPYTIHTLKIHNLNTWCSYFYLFVAWIL